MYKLIYLLTLFFVLGCSIKVPMERSQSVSVLIKSKKMRFYDIGFIRSNSKQVNLQLFNGGVAILDLDIKDDTCINKICYKRQSFNIDFLGYKYYDDFLKDIIMQKPIYNGKNLKLHVDGFTQNISTSHYDIYYKVGKNETYFKDSANKIVIKIQKI